MFEDEISVLTLSANSTFKAPHESGENLRFIRYTQSGLLFLFFILALIGNGAILSKLLYSRFYCSQRLSNISLLCLQLAIADLIAAFCCMLSNAILYLVEHFSAGDVACKLLRFLQRVGLASSTFIIIAISADRCFAILFPMHKTRLRQVVKLMIAGVWILAALFSIPQTVIFQVNISTLSGVEIYECSGFQEDFEPWKEAVYDSLYLVTLYIMPIVFVVTCYSLIYRRITKESDGIAGDRLIKSSSYTDSSNRLTLYKKARRTSFIVSIVVVLTFIVFWAPYYISLLCHLISKPADRGSDYYYNHAIYFCGLGHSVFNPLIYGAFHAVRRSRRSGQSCFGGPTADFSRTYTNGKTMRSSISTKMSLSKSLSGH